MKSILGFSVGDKPESKDITIVQKEELCPVRSLVSVQFVRSGRELTYYNDRFALEVGDRVFVSGKHAGEPGIVQKVTTKFRINLADYQRVISKAACTIHGTYESVMDKMVSYDRNALTPEEFRLWILPPVHWDSDESEIDDDYEIVEGDGYELHLPDLENSDEASGSALERATGYCCEGRIAYISVRDGIGTAFVEGTDWYEVNFRLRGDVMSEMYCDCPFPGLCKHLLAVAMTIRALSKIGNLDTDSDFVAISEDKFWSMVAQTTKRITL